MMKRKLISIIYTAFFFQTLLFGQTETYSVKIAGFSSNKYDEFSPVYYKNGIVYCSNGARNFLVNYSTSEYKGLFKIVFVDTITNRSKLLSDNLRSRFNDGPSSFSKSFDTVYFSRNLKVDGSVRENINPRNKLGIFTAVLEDNGWGKVRDLRFNNEYFNITTPCISPDGKRLFFASDNPEGYGGSDLYYSQWTGDYWGDPVNMGPAVNTSGNESYPFVNSEGGLFFSSDSLPGLGGKDIFFTKQVGSKWITPVNLDEPVNSKFDDFALIADSVMNKGYFSSRRGSSVDIYQFKTNIHQLFYCENERTNQYCFKFTDEGKIAIDDRYLQLIWDFGDGSTATGSNVEHCFPGPGFYSVKLNAVDKKKGTVFYTKVSYDLQLSEIRQPVIKSPASAMVGTPLSLDGLSSSFPGSKILNYTWDFGDGDRKEGENVNHGFSAKGDYEVKLGLIVRDDKTGIIHNACATKLIRVFDNSQSKTDYDNKSPKRAPLLDISDYDHALISNYYSSEKGFSPDVVFQVEIKSSKMKLGIDNAAFKNVPGKYRIREIYYPDDNIYSYIISEEMTLMATYPAFNDITSLGFKNALIKPYTLQDAASKEINNLKKVLGVSTDTFFRKNEYNLTSAGTQMLDLILGIFTKYPSLRLEISVHTDTLESADNNQLLSQKQAEAMVNYLIMNGVSPSRLMAKGYGGTRPIAPNYLEADRKVNRRVDFVILKD